MEVKKSFFYSCSDSGFWEKWKNKRNGVGYAGKKRKKRKWWFRVGGGIEQATPFFNEKKGGCEMLIHQPKQLIREKIGYDKAFCPS